MAVTVEERAKPYRGTADNRDWEFLIRGVDNYNGALSAAADQIPLVYPDTSLLRASIRLDQQGDTIWYATANYTVLGPMGVATVSPPEQPEVGTLVRSALFQAKEKTISRFLEPVGVFKYSNDNPAGVDVTSSKKRMKWKIDAAMRFSPTAGNSKSRKFEPLAESRTLTLYVPNVSVTDSYFDTIEDLVVNGAFNAGSYRGRPEGTLQIVSFSANERSADDWEFVFGFGYRAKETNVVINEGLQIPTLRPCDHYWTIEDTVWDADNPDGEAYDKYAIVGRAWHLADFSVLGLPS